MLSGAVGVIAVVAAALLATAAVRRAVVTESYTSDRRRGTLSDASLQVIDVFRAVLERPPSREELERYRRKIAGPDAFSAADLRDALLHSPEYERAAKMQSNDPRAGLERAVTERHMHLELQEAYMRAAGHPPDALTAEFLYERFRLADYDMRYLEKLISSVLRADAGVGAPSGREPDAESDAESDAEAADRSSPSHRYPLTAARRASSAPSAMRLHPVDRNVHKVVKSLGLIRRKRNHRREEHFRGSVDTGMPSEPEPTHIETFQPDREFPTSLARAVETSLQSADSRLKAATGLDTKQIAHASVQTFQSALKRGRNFASAMPVRHTDSLSTYMAARRGDSTTV